VLGRYGFRPVGGAPAATRVEGATDPANPFPAVETITVADLGGWSAVNDELFDKDNGLVAKLRS
jgi:sulfate transport system substrate-binding protein